MRLSTKAILACVFAAGCKAPPSADPTLPLEPSHTTAPKAAAPAYEEPAIPPPPPPAAVAPAPRPRTMVGMQDPFVRMNGEAMKRLGDAWTAARKKKYSEARAAFHDVVTAYPDKPAARFQELRMAALDGDFVAVPGLWRELLARDFVGYGKRLEQGKELAPLRKSAQWADVLAIKAEMKAAHARGLDKGFFFVARTRTATTPEFDDGIDSVKLDLDQEVYHFDPGTERVRRLTDTGGRVVGVHHDGRGQLVVLTATSLKKVEEGTAFQKPEAMMVALDTLETTGPIAMDATAVSVEMCFSGKGEPVWTVNATGAATPKSFTLDSTGTALVGMNEVCGSNVAATLVSPRGVVHDRPDPEGVALSDDGLQITGVDGDKPVRSSQAIRPGGFSWSPGKKRFVYTGDVERCDLLARMDQGQKPDANAVVVWDAERKASRRVAASVTSYEATWLDDDHLVYESGLDKAPKLTIHDFSAGGVPITVKAPAGAGLFGIPALPCPRGEILGFAR